MMKQSTIKLAYYVSGQAIEKKHEQWLVLQVTDSLFHNPGEYLEKQQVAELCNNGAWKVTIVRAEG